MTSASPTRMFSEAAQSAAALRLQLERNADTLARLGEDLRALSPKAVVTCARGSSDHAATFAKYLIETRAGVLTSSAAPSIASVYGAQQDMRGCLFLAISQSGRSPDLVAATEAARDAGAIIVALVNEEDAPLAAAADHAIPLCAGAEESVPATKSFIAALGAIVHLVAEWTRDVELREALVETPAALERAWALDWSAGVAPLEQANHLYVIARGPGLAIPQEAALKCKEVCALDAEAFSSAEWAFLIDADRIVDVVSESDPRCATARRHDLGGGFLLPGFIDTQVNGGGGALFNEDPSVDTLRVIGAAHRRFGTTSFLPTLISDDLSVIARAIDAVRDAIAAKVPGVIGIHIEGPCLNPRRKGA